MKGSALYPVSPVSFPTQVGKLVLVGTLLHPSGVSPQGIVKPCKLYRTVLYLVISTPVLCAADPPRCVGLLVWRG